MTNAGDGIRPVGTALNDTRYPPTLAQKEILTMILYRVNTLTAGLGRHQYHGRIRSSVSPDGPGTGSRGALWLLVPGIVFVAAAVPAGNGRYPYEGAKIPPGIPCSRQDRIIPLLSGFPDPDPFGRTAGSVVPGPVMPVPEFPADRIASGQCLW